MSDLAMRHRYNPHGDSEDIQAFNVSVGARPAPKIIMPIDPEGKFSIWRAALDGLSTVQHPLRHRYVPLKENQIRVLVLKPNPDPTAQIEIELHNEDLVNGGSDAIRHPFQALSYEWSSNYPRYPIIVQDMTYQFDGGQLQRIREDHLARTGRPAPALTLFRHSFRCWLNNRLYFKPGEKESPRAWFAPTRLVRENLHNALLQFRHPNKPMRLWVDALCIDQFNVAEKSSQIQRMAEIYHAADIVRIWLGRPYSNLELESKGKSIAEPTEQDIQRFERLRDEREQTERALTFIRELADLRNLNSILSRANIQDDWLALIVFMRHGWFSRRWVIQQQGVARKAYILYGDKGVNWTDFASAVSMFRRDKHAIRKALPRNNSRLDTDIFQVFDGLGGAVMTRQSTLVIRRGKRTQAAGDIQVLEKLKNLEELVCDYTAFASSDPRDSIYAMLPISKKPKALTPDYKKSLLDVYCQFLQSVIISSDDDSVASLDILCRPWAPADTTLQGLVNKPGEEDGSSNINADFRKIKSSLPTWIRRTIYEKPEDMLRGRIHGNVFASIKTPYHACSGSPRGRAMAVFGKLSEPKRTMQLTEEYDGQLTVRGIILGTVVSTAPPSMEGTIPREVFRMGWKDSQENKSRDPDEVPDQLWRSLVANQGIDGLEPPPFFKRAFLYAFQDRGAKGHLNISTLIRNKDTPAPVVDYLEQVLATVQDRVAFLGGLKDKKNLFGFGPEATKPRRGAKRDHICILYGCRVPVILRKTKRPLPKFGLEVPPTTSRQNTALQGQGGVISPGLRSAMMSDQGSSSEDDSDASEPEDPEVGEPLQERWTVVGECYVDGYMNGEAMSDPDMMETEREFVLI